jgi:hypothetical protein
VEGSEESDGVGGGEEEGYAAEREQQHGEKVGEGGVRIGGEVGMDWERD